MRKEKQREGSLGMAIAAQNLDDFGGVINLESHIRRLSEIESSSVCSIDHDSQRLGRHRFAKGRLLSKLSPNLTQVESIQRRAFAGRPVSIVLICCHRKHRN